MEEGAEVSGLLGLVVRGRQGAAAEPAELPPAPAVAEGPDKVPHAEGEVAEALRGEEGSFGDLGRGSLLVVPGADLGALRFPRPRHLAVVLGFRGAAPLARDLRLHHHLLVPRSFLVGALSSDPDRREGADPLRAPGGEAPGGSQSEARESPSAADGLLPSRPASQLRGKRAGLCVGDAKGSRLTRRRELPRARDPPPPRGAHARGVLHPRPPVSRLSLYIARLGPFDCPLARALAPRFFYPQVDRTRDPTSRAFRIIWV